jgi:hypothetical protein
MSERFIMTLSISDSTKEECAALATKLGEKNINQMVGSLIRAFKSMDPQILQTLREYASDAGVDVGFVIESILADKLAQDKAKGEVYGDIPAPKFAWQENGEGVIRGKELFELKCRDYLSDEVKSRYYKFVDEYLKYGFIDEQDELFLKKFNLKVPVAKQ